ncbi:hypothetical protein QTP70_014184, partial [Hemibagrus guttatus]
NLFTFYMLCWRVCGMSDSARVYLSFLAVVDTCYLLWVTLLDLSLVFLQPQPFWHAHPWCSVINFLQFGTFYASAWLVVAFTIERYLVFRVMAIPQRHLQVRHALLTCISIVLLSHLASIPLSWINTVVQVNLTWNGQTVTVPRCLYREAFYSTVVVGGDVLPRSAGPFGPPGPEVPPAGHCCCSGLSRWLFVILGLPRFITYCILRTKHNHKDFNRDDYTVAINVVGDVANMLHNLNSGTNFLLYCVVSRRFRHEIVNTFRCRVRGRELGSFFTQTTMKVFSVAERRDAAGRDPVSIVLTKLRHLEQLSRAAQTVPPCSGP